MPGAADLGSDTQPVAKGAAVVAAAAPYRIHPVLGRHHHHRLALDMTQSGNSGRDLVGQDAVRGEVRSAELGLYCHVSRSLLAGLVSAWRPWRLLVTVHLK